MINIPDEIKDLLHLDSCKKNIRIHFPNGERSDICNDLIVKDSVSLKESLCSQNKFKFGLCESPVFECEVVGVGNIRNCTIEVSCEIFCDSSVSGAIWQTDIQAWVYPIQYGTFVVRSADRQADMIHRKLVTYNAIAASDWGLSKWEAAKGYPGLLTGGTYNAKIIYWLMGNQIKMSETLFTKTTIQPWATYHDDFPASGYYVAKRNGVGYNIKIIRQYKQWNFDLHNTGGYYPSSQEVYDLLKFSCSSQESLQAIKDYAKGFENAEAGLLNCLNSYCGFNVSYSKKGGKTVYQEAHERYPFYIYPWCDNFYQTSGTYPGDLTIYAPTSIEIAYYTRNTQEYIRSDIFDVCNNPICEKLVLNDNTLKSLTFPIPEIAGANYIGNGYFVDYSDIDVNELTNSFFEIIGKFGEFTRDGGINIKDIKQSFNLLPDEDLYPGENLKPLGPNGGSILPEDYESCWYEDYYSLPYGLIKVNYTDTNGNKAIYNYYIDGYDSSSDPSTYQVYEIDNNYYLTKNRLSDSQVETICGLIEDAIDGVTFMPVKLKGRGLPYVQPGDTFEILTKSGDSITTIVLDRTLKGEMHLVDEYSSVS